MKLLYKPFGIVVGILSGLLSKKLFEFIWSKIDDAEPPEATTEYVPVGKAIGAAALEGMVFKGTRAAMDRAGARGYSHLTGVWPGEKTQDPE